MNTLIKLAQQQPKTVKPEQTAQTQKFSENDAGGGHCQGGGSW
ncbi:hypothetical protein [Halomonas sp. I5-271120]|nr:hypothetical protein [Halomonas sp. I5-271120]